MPSCARWIRTALITGVMLLAVPEAARSEAALLFRSGFEGSVAVDGMDIRGSDGMDWQTDLEKYEAVQGFWLYNRGDSSFAELRTDPTDDENQCLYLQVDSGNRMQCELNFKEEADYQQVYVRFRVYWPADLGRLREYPGAITWFTFLEIWEHHNDAEPGDQAGKTRWTFSFLKDEGAGEPLYWGVDAQGAQPDWHDLWDARNRVVPIPFGKWCVFEMLYKRGKGRNGRIWMAVTPEGKERNVVFDLRRDTQHPVNAMPLRSFQLWKLYTHKKMVRWMSEQNRPIHAYYDDFEWWTDIPQERK